MVNPIDTLLVFGLNANQNFDQILYILEFNETCIVSGPHNIFYIFSQKIAKQIHF